METNNQKILFWLDKEPKFLGLCKFIQEKYSAQYYAVIDINYKMKKFYENQNLVKFEKVWFYRDHILEKNKKPDMKYLNSIEEKYKINLWKIIYADRNFYQFNKYYKFSYDEILSIVEQECKLFDSILKEVSPDFFIIGRPDFHHLLLFQEMARATGIKLLILDHPRIGYRSLITDQPDEIDEIDRRVSSSSKELRTFDELREYVKGYGNQFLDNALKDLRTSKSKQFKASIEFLINVCNADYRKHYANYGRTRIQVLKNEGSLPIKRWYRKQYIDKHLITKISNVSKFIYFPLHFEPEETLLISAPYHTDQISVIKNIAKSIPIGFKLFVKEHPAMTLNGWRPKNFYENILSMPNVEFIHPSVSNELLLEKCSMVITISGTTGLEAAFYKKSTIVMTDISFTRLPSVEKLNNFEDLPGLIKSSLEKEVNLEDVNDYVSFMEEISFPYEATRLSKSARHKFFYGGYLYEIYLSESQLLSYFEENQSIFDYISSQYVNKIKLYNESV